MHGLLSGAGIANFECFGEVAAGAAPYQGPPANLTQGYPNLTQLAMTAQFYRQDAVAAPNLTHLGLTWPNHARHCSESKKRKGSQAGGALRTPPAGDVFLAVTAVSRVIGPG